MVSCDDFLAALDDYLEGQTPSELRRELERHLAHCVTCQVIADSAVKTLKIITESGEFDLSEELPQKAIDDIMDRVRKSVRPVGEPHTRDPRGDE